MITKLYIGIDDNREQMYNTHFICTYKMHDVNDEETQDVIYRFDYLSAFGLKEYDSDVIMKTLEEVYEKLKCDKDFVEILEAHPRFVAEKKNYEFVMQLMFSFDTFNLFHNCLVYLLYKYRPIPDTIESFTSENLYSYFTFTETKNKLIEQLKI